MYFTADLVNIRYVLIADGIVRSTHYVSVLDSQSVGPKIMYWFLFDNNSGIDEIFG